MKTLTSLLSSGSRCQLCDASLDLIRLGQWNRIPIVDLAANRDLDTNSRYRAVRGYTRGPIDHEKDFFGWREVDHRTKKWNDVLLKGIALV